MRGDFILSFLCIKINLTTHNNVCYNEFEFRNKLKSILEIKEE